MDRRARMPSISTGGIDIRNILNSIVNVVKSKANQICTAPCDGLVLKMHYRWTFCVLIGGFFTVWYQWYHRDVITCVSNFNAETQVRLDYINICLSYPYTETGDKRRYLLFYRWIHWSLLMLAGIYYIPRKVSKNVENKKAKKLMEDIAANVFRYDNAEKELVDRAVRFLTFNLRTHNGLYTKFVSVNVTALVIDILTFQYLDFIFQGRFTQYGFQAYPFERDPKNFSDYMSQMFPPFASCELNEVTKLTNDRTEKFGCHLTMMELYEKLFLALWLWLILLTTITIGYLIFLSTMLLPCVRVYLLRTSKPMHANDRVSQVIKKVADRCKVGDMYFLYRLKQHFSDARFYEVLCRISDAEFGNNQNQAQQEKLEREKLAAAQKQQQIENQLRNRKPMHQNPPINPEYHQLLNPQQHMPGNHHMYPNVGMNPDMIQRGGPPVKKTNTSILLEDE